MQVEPVSRTDQYKRVMKPLLERKRRARINRCLDELRDLLVAALQAEGETVTRLEKADILELTVRHVRRLNQRRRLTLPPQPDPRQDAVKFQQGFLAAAQQVQSFLLTAPSAIEPSASSRLLVHLSSCASAITNPPSAAPVPTQRAPVVHPPSPTPSTSPPPALMDLSRKSHPTVTIPRPEPSSAVAVTTSSATSPRVIVVPSPVRKEPYDPYPAVPEDLSVKRDPKPEDLEGSDAWRPW